MNFPRIQLPWKPIKIILPNHLFRKSLLWGKRYIYDTCIPPDPISVFVYNLFLCRIRQLRTSAMFYLQLSRAFIYSNIYVILSWKTFIFFLSSWISALHCFFWSQVYIGGYIICELCFYILKEHFIVLILPRRHDLTKVTELTDIPGYGDLSIFHSLSVSKHFI